MQRFLTVLVCAAAIAAGGTTPATAAMGEIDRACRMANRDAASPELCTCIQKVANSSLSRSERRKVAKWFSDPHQAQVVRQSDKRRDEDLWKRYKAFGEKAQQVCG